MNNAMEMFAVKIAFVCVCLIMLSLFHLYFLVQVFVLLAFSIRISLFIGTVITKKKILSDVG